MTKVAPAVFLTRVTDNDSFWWLLAAILGALGLLSRLALPGPDLLVAGPFEPSATFRAAAPIDDVMGL